MDIYKELRDEHKKVKGLVAKMKMEKNGNMRQKQLEQLKEDLLPHMFAEEKTLYGHLLSKSSDKDLMYEALEEHFSARSVLFDIEKTSVEDPSWKGKVSVLEELLKHHIKEEESEVFEESRKHLDKQQAQDMVREFKELKQDTRVQKAAA